MIRSITVTNYRGDSMKLDLAKPELSGFAVKSISGLGPGKATVNTSEVSTNDGSLYNSARLSERNIVISLLYLWKDTIEDARQLSYKYFPIKKKLTLLVETDNRKLEIDGYVESNEPTVFSKSEGSEISIVCPEPYFRSAYGDGTNTTYFSGIEPIFEFPFSNESLEEDLLEIGNVLTVVDKSIVYNGDSEVGVTINIHAVGEASNITIYNTTARESMYIDTEKLASLTGSGLKFGDDIIICTVKGRKSVKLLRDGIATNILNCLSKDSDWLQLSKGDNVFAYVAETGTTELQLSITNQIIYEGV